MQQCVCLRAVESLFTTNSMRTKGGGLAILYAPSQHHTYESGSKEQLTRSKAKQSRFSRCDLDVQFLMDASFWISYTSRFNIATTETVGISISRLQSSIQPENRYSPPSHRPYDLNPSSARRQSSDNQDPSSPAHRALSSSSNLIPWKVDGWEDGTRNGNHGRLQSAVRWIDPPGPERH